MKSALIVILFVTTLSGPLRAGGLTPSGSTDEPSRILDLHVEVLGQDGFSPTDSTQTLADRLPRGPGSAAMGTFMMVLKSELDLPRHESGADYSFVIDISGSMEDKMGALTDGMADAIGRLRSEDRFRIVVFNDRARALTGGWLQATPENVQRAVDRVGGLAARGGTNLYHGLHLGLQSLDSGRTTSVILVTDGVANSGVLDPRAFRALMARVDVRVSGVLLRSDGNWPLIETICNTYSQQR